MVVLNYPCDKAFTAKNQVITYKYELNTLSNYNGEYIKAFGFKGFRANKLLKFESNPKSPIC